MELRSSRLRPSWIGGEVHLGRYRVVSQIGEGGFGRVYQADDLRLGRQVALKVARRQEHEGRLEREARLAARLTSPHSVRIFDVQRLEDESTLIVMELLSGQSLREYLSMRGRVDVSSALSWALELGEALLEAHSIGLVHRDLKPSNLFLAETNAERTRIKLLDFGLARVPEGSDEHTLTGADVILGSPAYMSPEQIRSGRVSHQSDIWSFGVVLHEMLAGRRPFRADSNLGLIAAISADPPESLAKVRPGLPSELYELIARCLNKLPEERFTNIGEAMKVLGGLVSTELGFESQTGRIITFTVNPEQSQSETTLPLRESTAPISTSVFADPSLSYSVNERRAEASNRGVLGALLAAAVALGLGAFVWFRVPVRAPAPHSVGAQRSKVEAPLSAVNESVKPSAEGLEPGSAQSGLQTPARLPEPPVRSDSDVVRSSTSRSPTSTGAPSSSPSSIAAGSKSKSAPPPVRKVAPEPSTNPEPEAFFAQPDF